MNTATAQVRMLAIGVALPLAITIGGVVAVLLALPSLPDPVAVHWGPTGEPDGFGSPWLALVLPPVIVVAYSVFAVPVAAMTRARGTVTANQKMIMVIGPFLSVVVTGVIAGSTVMQSGLTDAQDAGSILPLLLVIFGIAIAIAVVSWLVLPPVSPAPPAPDPAELPRLDLDDTARAVWTQPVGPSRALGVSLTVILSIAIIAGGTVLALVAPVAAFLVYVIGMGALLVLVVGTLHWNVTIDGRGVRVISVVGFPRFVVPLDEVESADAIDVQPVGDFGGWGLRWGGRRRFGIILRSGEALEVRRRDGRQLVVTVSGARTGAALLNALSARAAATRPAGGEGSA